MLHSVGVLHAVNVYLVHTQVPLDVIVHRVTSRSLPLSDGREVLLDLTATVASVHTNLLLADVRQLD